MILGMDTSSDTMTIALFNEGVVIGEYTTNLRKIIVYGCFQRLLF